MSPDADTPLLTGLDESAGPAKRLTALQRSAIEQFAARERASTPNPCLCGAARDRLLAASDRFGLPIRALLCEGCGLVRIDPYFDEASIAAFYQHDYRGIYTEAWADPEDYFERQQWRGRRVREWLAEHVDGRPRRVLEVGCGAGGVLDAFREAGCEVAGCDYGAEMLEVGRRHGLELVEGGAEALLPFAPADLVILSHVVEHLRDPIAVLRQVTALLGERGRIYIEVPGVLTIRERDGDVHNYLQNAHVWNFCAATLDAVAARAGLRRVAGNEYVQAVYEPADDGGEPAVEVAWSEAVAAEVRASLERAHRLRRLPVLRSLPATAARWARPLLGKHLYRLARRAYCRLGGRLP